MYTTDGVKFGKELREKEFLFDKGFLNLNHGMFLQAFSFSKKSFSFESCFYLLLCSPSDFFLSMVPSSLHK